MKIAVTYDNGEVFQHFGHTETFKIYEVEDGRVTESRVLGSGGTGHGALAGLLGEEGIEVLICGGIGGGAQAALAERGIELVAGAVGDADEAVEAYLRGELVSTGANCHHHDGDHDCGDHPCGDHGCEEHEGGCAGCHAGGPSIEGRNVGRRVSVHYRGTFNSGEQFDSSYDRGEPLNFICGAGQMIGGFDAAVADMVPGERKNVHLMPEEAYGLADPNAIFTLALDMLPGAEDLKPGQQVWLQGPNGDPVPVVVLDMDETSITFDANDPMAGKELNFEIELLEVD
ncbi:MAG: FKBP-type peptidyl-prolyl cis-trans isomerase [Lachnospiraceae bacterium]|nr:FKBP-type peptidyl-prolyl cis-trans isomerase [Lachnospiraceae bacterium]